MEKVLTNWTQDGLYTGQSTCHFISQNQPESEEVSCFRNRISLRPLAVLMHASGTWDIHCWRTSGVLAGPKLSGRGCIAPEKELAPPRLLLLLSHSGSLLTVGSGTQLLLAALQPSPVNQQEAQEEEGLHTQSGSDYNQ